MSSWYDRFAKVWANTGVSTDPSDAQANAGFSFLGAAPPSVELFNAMFKWNDQKDTYLYNQMASVFTWGGQTASETNPNTLRDSIIAKQRIVLTADTILYVDVAGNDTTGNGSIGNPWKTIRNAYAYVLNWLDLAGHWVVIQLKSPGVYEYCDFQVAIGNGAIHLTGDKLNPKLYIIRNTNGAAISVQQSVVLYLSGLAIEATGLSAPQIGDPGGWGVIVVRSGLCFIDAVAFGNCTLSQMIAGEGGVIWPMKKNATMIVYGNPLTAGHSVAHAQTAGNVVLVSMIATFEGARAGIFATATIAGVVQVYDFAFTGNITGQKYVLWGNGVLNASGQSATLPGTVAGAVSTGGQVIQEKRICLTTTTISISAHQY